MLIPVILITLPHNAFSYYLMMTTYFLAYCGSLLLQGNLIGCLSIYGSTYTVIFFTFQAVFNFLVMISKITLLEIRSTVLADLIVLWGIYLLVSLIQLWSFYYICKSP